ncbi:probable prefoldin subunit 5 isoform X2 [Parasteatoda tepidariorum]|uniref:probable prefoldin subunit 5 isoform X2 n=1 Tax=Parasteatoda tepidariorum TaxID=114398 RepID=UPI001C727036|nr:uncharacterized protein LOC107436094 [Parasteatoda tepidariorum]
MAVVNVEMTETLSPDVSKQTLSQVVRQKEETEAEIESLCNLMYQLNKTRTKFESTVDIVKNLNSPSDNSLAFNNMFIQGDVGQNNKILVSLGGEYNVEVEKDAAINHFVRKLQRVKSKIYLTQKMLASKMKDAERLKKAAVDIMDEMSYGNSKVE